MLLCLIALHIQVLPFMNADFPSVFVGNTDVTQITASSTKTCSSGALSMASLSAVSVVGLALAAVFAL